MTGKPGTAEPTLSAQEAAVLLDVSLATLYTYASRRRLRVVKRPGERSSRYVRADVERLLAGRRRGDPAQTGPVLAATTGITLMTRHGSWYRGVPAVELSRTATLEQTACLLWDTGASDPFGQDPPAPPPGWDEMLARTASLPPLDRLSALLPVLKAGDVHAHDASASGLWRTGAAILRWAATVMAGLPKPPRGPIHEAVAAALGHRPPLDDATRRVLVLAADQALEPTTLAVRATANTGATPYHCVASGLAAATGGRLPSVRVGSFARFIAEIEGSADPCDPVLVRVREHETLPGFGYVPAAFEGVDPRTAALWSFLCTSLADDRRFGRFRRAVELATAITGLQADFAFLAAWVGRAPDGERFFNLIRLGRIAGWLAHAFEQQLREQLVRPVAGYDGPAAS